MNGCKVKSSETIPASELQPGQIAVICDNIYGLSFNGTIVSRVRFNTTDYLCQLGHPALFSSKASDLTGDKCRVRVLKAGEQITVC